MEIDEEDDILSPKYSPLRKTSEDGDPGSFVISPTHSRSSSRSSSRSRSRSPIPPPLIPLKPVPPHPSPVPPIPPKGNELPRPKAYPNESVGPFIVYFRPIKKALNVVRIAGDLNKNFSGVTEIMKVRPNKLRVTVSSAKVANDIVKFKLFTLEYRVYIPSRDVEIDGVITEQSLTCEEILQGEGRFKTSALQSVQILDCKQLHSASVINGNKIYKASDSFRVTFSGSALPDYVVIDKIRFPVRMFYPKVMNCLNCKQLGHTATYCCNKTRCDKCGETHEGICTNDAEKCVYCGEDPHDLVTCPTYLSRKDKLKQSLKTRSRRTFAEMLKKSHPSEIPLENNYADLPIDVVDNGDPLEGHSQSTGVIHRKRINNVSPSLARKEQKVSGDVHVGQHQKNIKFQASKQITSGPGKISSVKDFPPLPKKPEPPAIPIKFQPAPAIPTKPSNLQDNPDSAMFSFTSIVNGILDFFNISDPLRSFIALILPSVKSLLQSLTLKWPLLGALISFDS